MNNPAMLSTSTRPGERRPVNNMATFITTEKFLAKHLGGRFQEGATPEATARLKEITVDVKTVTLRKKWTPLAQPVRSRPWI